MFKISISYGIDAPLLVRNLFLFSALALSGAAGTFLIKSAPLFWIFFVGFMTLSFFLAMASCCMVFISLFLKPILAERIINSLKLQGNEVLLDIGCGRGLFLIEAAKHLPKGKAYGIDLWSKDQSGNSLESTLLNLRASKVENQTEVFTGNMCKLPFQKAFFDHVISNLAIHNVPNEEGRNRALLEILRVLKPGGKFTVLDLHYGQHYMDFLKGTGAVEDLLLSPVYPYFSSFKKVQGLKSKHLKK